MLRWEYRLGSTLYLVYVRSQNAALAIDPLQAPRLDLGAFREAPATDTFMLKLSYWFG